MPIKPGVDTCTNLRQVKRCATSIAANHSELFGFIPVLQFEYENLNF